jgi:hypothetical protein
VSYFSDVYGYDARMVAALGGKPLPPEMAGGDEPVRDGARRSRPPKPNDFLSGIFGN